MRTGQTCYPDSSSQRAPGDGPFCLPYSRGDNCATPSSGGCLPPWCHALWHAQGTGGGSARFSQHREVSVPQPCHPCSALHTLQGSCLALQPRCVPPFWQQQAGGGDTSMPQSSLCWGTRVPLHIAELRAGLHPAQGTAACRFPHSTWRHAERMLEVG